MKRLILHVGLPKTGSSALQWFLTVNRAQLEKRGMLYPSRYDLFRQDGTLEPAFQRRRLKPKLGGNSHHNNLRRELTNREVDQKRFSPDEFTFQKLESALRYAPFETIIVSAENLVDIATGRSLFERFCSLAPEIDYRVSVVMFIRPQSSWANSKYTQVVKMLRYTGSFSDFSDSFVRNSGPGFGDKLDAWKSFRDAELIAIPFTRQHQPQGLETSFFHAIGHTEVMESLVSPGAPPKPPRRAAAFGRAQSKSSSLFTRIVGMFRRRKEAKLSTVNQSPGPKTIAACLYAARQLDAVGEGFESPLRQEIGVILQETGAALGWNREKFNGVTSEIRNKLEKNFKDENERLARTYWGTSWHETFREEYERDLLSNEIRLDKCEPETRTEICDVVRSVFEARGIVSRDKQV